MSDLQSLFSGTETPPAHLALDAEALTAYLARQVGSPVGSLDIAKFRGGQSNPTYLLSMGQHRWVLRRKPPGKLVPTAHAIDREYRVIQAIQGTGIPVPRPHVYCEDTSVIGSEFYIVEYLQGRVLWDPTLPDMTIEDRAAIYDDANRWLAAIHSLDIEARGLTDFGRGERYVIRNLKRWSDQYRAAELTPIADMHWLMDSLASAAPKSAPVRLIHGDYGLYNLIVHAVEPRIVGILDWEMATLGDPFVDLAHSLRPWWLQPDDKGEVPTLVGRQADAEGVPSMNVYVTSYLRRMGLTSWPNQRFYLAYAQFRYAAMVQGVLKRFADGTAVNRRTVHTQERVIEAARTARAILESSTAS